MNSLERILEGIMSSLTTEIVPRVDDAFARGQALAIVDLLRNIGPRLEWSHAILWQQIEAQEAAMRRVAELCSGLAAKPPAALPRSFGEHPTANELLSRRDDLSAVITAALIWLDSERRQLPAASRDEIEKILRSYMHEQLQRDMSLTAMPLFKEISKGGKTAAK
jgi:hypothetical protein